MGFRVQKMKGIVGASVVIAFSWQHFACMSLPFLCVGAGVIELISLHFPGFPRVCSIPCVLESVLLGITGTHFPAVLLEVQSYNLQLGLAPAETTTGRDYIARTYAQITYFKKFKGVYGCKCVLGGECAD
jgi:hypothetical protein